MPSQGLKPIPCGCAVGQPGVIAEEFLAIVDPPIAVQIQNQESVIGACPTGLLGKPVGIQVEVECSGVERKCLDTVTIQIQHQRGGHLINLPEAIL